MASKNRESRKFMLAVDGSECSKYALQYYLNMICSERDYLILIHVRETLLGGLFCENESKNDVEEYESMLEWKSNELLQAFRSIVEKSRFSYVFDHCVTRTLKGDPREKLFEAVKEFRPDLLIMGSHGKGLLSRALLGSVSDHMVHHSPCPVLIVKPPETSWGFPGAEKLGKIVEMAS